MPEGLYEKNLTGDTHKNVSGGSQLRVKNCDATQAPAPTLLKNYSQLFKNKQS
jgi:hypothetical protein